MGIVDSWETALLSYLEGKIGHMLWSLKVYVFLEEICRCSVFWKYIFLVRATLVLPVENFYSIKFCIHIKKQSPIETEL